MGYDVKTGKLNFSTKSGILVDLELKYNKVIVGGDSATGKTFICNFIETVQNEISYDSAYDFSNIFVLRKQNVEKLCKLNNHLIIIDRADVLLNEPLVRTINDDKSNRYLIFARGVTGIVSTPNNYAKIVREDKTLKLEYLFNERGW